MALRAIPSGERSKAVRHSANERNNIFTTEKRALVNGALQIARDTPQTAREIATLRKRDSIGESVIEAKAAMTSSRNRGEEKRKHTRQRETGTLAFYFGTAGRLGSTHASCFSRVSRATAERRKESAAPVRPCSECVRERLGAFWRDASHTNETTRLPVPGLGSGARGAREAANKNEKGKTRRRGNKRGDELSPVAFGRLSTGNTTAFHGSRSGRVLGE